MYRSRTIIALAVVAISSASGLGRPVGLHTPGIVHAAQGVATISDIGAVDTLNPYVQEQNADADKMNIDIIRPTGIGPFYGPNGSIQPGMLASVPTVANGGISANYLTYHFTLQAGLKWSNGTPITSEDVLYAWHIGMNANAGWCAPGAGDRSCSAISSITIAPPLSFTWHLTSAYAPALINSWPGMLPYGWAALGTAAQRLACLNAVAPSYSGCDAVAQNLTASGFNYTSPTDVVAGPYRLHSFHNNGMAINYIRNGYYKPLAAGGMPRLHELKYRGYGGTTALIAASNDNDTDVAQGYGAEDSNTLMALRQVLGNTFTVLSSGGIAPEQVMFNVSQSSVTIDTSSGPPVSNVSNPTVTQQVRQALALALNPAKVIGSAFQLTTAVSHSLASHTTPILRSPLAVAPFSDAAITGAWDPIAGSYVHPGSPQAITDAKTLLTEAGYTGNGPTVYLSTNALTFRMKEANAVAAAWQTIGVHTIIETLQSGFLASYSNQGTLTNGHFEAAIVGVANDTPDPDAWSGIFLPGNCPGPANDSGNNFGCVTDAHFVTDLTNGETHTQSGVRQTAYNAFSVRMSREAYWLPAGDRYANVWTTNLRVHGVKMNPYTGDVTWNVYSWHL